MTRAFIALLLLLASSACAGDLENPERFLDGGQLSSTCSPGVDGVAEILEASCTASGCHGAYAPNVAPDLASPGIATRLVDVTSQGCTDRVLVDSANPQDSYLLEKLRPDPSCGNQMPLGGTLSEDDIACVEQWVEGL